MYGPPAKPQTMMPMIGGILLMVAGLTAIGFWAYVAFVAATLVEGFVPIGGGLLTGIIAVCGAIMIILGIIALLGGLMALRRKMWALALVGSILGLFTIGFYGISSLLSFVALIILVIARKEF